jgi:hypothetical protein
MPRTSLRHAAELLRVKGFISQRVGQPEGVVAQDEAKSDHKERNGQDGRITGCRKRQRRGQGEQNEHHSHAVFGNFVDELSIR